MTPRELYFSFFMFSVDLRPGDAAYAETIVRHMSALSELGYAGVDLPIAATPTRDHAAEVERYAALKDALDAAGVGDVGISTNVGATRTFNPASPYAEQREDALAYLKSRVDITALLGGELMAGPIIFPYGAYPTGDFGDPFWSDALQDWTAAGYEAAQPVLQELGEYAQAKGVTLAIEPVDHWETAAPNLVGEVLAFLEGVPSTQVGVCVDSAHVLLGEDGPAAFTEQIAASAGRVHAVHVSAPGRGAMRDSWIPWDAFLAPILPVYDGPLLVEVFNAIPPFLESLRLTRRKFWIPGEDAPVDGVPDAYTVAGEALAATREAVERSAT
ncbi:MAG TPA: sugar phosphate isomerase/epimerase family protein [Solirubrobacter sp.]